MVMIVNRLIKMIFNIVYFCVKLCLEKNEPDDAVRRKLAHFSLNTFVHKNKLTNMLKIILSTY